MADKHDGNHQFMRFETSNSQGYLITIIILINFNSLFRFPFSRVMVPKRAGSLKITSKGIFKNAIVVRGPDWDWQDQDGGEGKSGKVLEIRGWDRESGNSVACVQWNGSGCSNVYRVGHKGKVDLKYIQEGVGGFYYKDHLAVFGLIDEPIISISNLSLNSTSNSFSVGDKVKINVSIEVFKQTQEGHGGWNQKMADVRFKT